MLEIKIICRIEQCAHYKNINEGEIKKVYVVPIVVPSLTERAIIRLFDSKLSRIKKEGHYYMRKYILSLLIALILVACSIQTSFAAYVGLNNFTKTNSYTSERFLDVSPSDWFEKSVACTYELGLMNGSSNTTFNPSGNITLSETIVLAARLHSIYYTGSDNFIAGSPWYQTYVDYAIANKIITSVYSDYTKEVSRAEFAVILKSALPIVELPVINDLKDNTIPDVKISDDYGTAVYTLYKAGILTGNDKYGTFTPNAAIERSSVAAIIARMADTTLRKSFTLVPPPIVTTNISITPTSTLIFVGNSVGLTATVLPEDTTDKTIIWKTSDPKTAIVSDGIVTGVSAGTATITATSANGLVASSTVSIEKRESIRILSTYVPINSVGGASPHIIWRNDSGKTIKYITFTAIPYNAVGDVVSSSIGGKTTAQLQVTGPIETFNNETDINYSDFYYRNSIPYVQRSSDGYYVTHWSGSKYYLIESDYQNVFNIRSEWDSIWYNESIDHIQILKVYIVYMDGSTETLTSPKIWRHYL